MTDFYFEDYDRQTREKRESICCESFVILCVVIIGFALFMVFYYYIWNLLFGTVASYGYGLLTGGLIIAVILAIYVVRNRSLEKRKVMAAS